MIRVDPMQVIDLQSQQTRIRKEVEAGINSVLDHGRYIGGPDLSQLELAPADYIDIKHVIARSSGADALLL